VNSTAILAQRLSSQGLAGKPKRDPVEVAEALLAIQAQDPRGARLAIRARSSGLSAADVDRALSLDRSLLISWLNRGTLHLVRSEDYPLLQLLTTPRLLGANARRLAQEGVSAEVAERGIGVNERSLGRDGPLTRPQLRERLDSAGVPTAGQALVHLLILASLRGLIVRGPVLGRQHAFVLVRDWLELPRPPLRDSALAELARRYLLGHAPATDRDLARWAGLTLGDARCGLEAISSRLLQGENGLLELSAQPPAQAIPAPRLLGAFDPVLLGWQSRQEILGAHAKLVTSNGLFRPFAMVKGRAVASWKIAGGEVAIKPLEPLTEAASAALEADALAVTQFLAPAG
jgi:hypothetical protein